MYKNKSGDARITGDYLTNSSLLLKQPVLIQRQEKNLYLPDFGVNVPNNSTPAAILTKISAAYRDLEHRVATGQVQVDKTDPQYKLWLSMCTVVDREAMSIQYQRTTPEKQVIEIRETRRGKIIRSTTGLRYKIDRELKEKLNALPAGYFETDLAIVDGIVTWISPHINIPDYAGNIKKTS